MQPSLRESDVGSDNCEKAVITLRLVSLNSSLISERLGGGRDQRDERFELLPKLCRVGNIKENK